jgi:putative methionine-R-sulfoxide reductase with GAF domain
MVDEITSFVAECFWPGVHESDLHALDARALERAAVLNRAGEDVRYLGSILLRDDEVVLCRFQGGSEAVRRVAVEAEIPFERILEAAQSPWPLG